MLKPINCMSANARNWSTSQRPGNDGNSGEHDQKLIELGEAHNEWAHQIWAQSNQRCMYLQKGRNCLTNQRTENGRNSAVWPKVNQVGGGPNWVCSLNLSSIQSTFCLKMCRNCLTNQRPGNCRDSVEQDHLGQSGKGRPPVSLFTKFEFNGLSENAQKLLKKSEARKRLEFSGTWPKIDQARRGP